MYVSTAHSISVSADLAHSQDVRDIVKKTAEEHGFSTQDVGRFVLVADELFMNAVKYGCDVDDTVEIALEQVAPNGLKFTITDAGARGISPDELRAKIAHHEDTVHPGSTSGRGLAIITQAWMDEFDIEAHPDGGLVISCTKYIS